MIELKYKISIGYITVLNILQNVRLVIANYVKDKYRRYKIGGPPEKHNIVALDECLMKHDHRVQQWVVDVVDTETYKMRFDIILIRNQANLEIFVNNHIEPGTLIVTDR